MRTPFCLGHLLKTDTAIYSKNHPPRMTPRQRITGGGEALHSTEIILEAFTITCLLSRTMIVAKSCFQLEQGYDGYKVHNLVAQCVASRISEYVRLYMANLTVL
jgi:hypothetical protein